MNGYTIKPSIEPNDKYEKAKKDALQALDSIRDLNMQQQQLLFKELVSIWQFRMLIDNFQKMGR